MKGLHEKVNKCTSSDKQVLSFNLIIGLGKILDHYIQMHSEDAIPKRSSVRGLISLSSEVTGTDIQEQALGGPGFLIGRPTLIPWGRQSRIALSPQQLLHTYVNANSGKSPNRRSSDKYL
jgi:hypothetical protein